MSAMDLPAPAAVTKGIRLFQVGSGGHVQTCALTGKQLQSIGSASHMLCKQSEQHIVAGT